MMMDEARCLERLVEQRSHRISYTRLLSWEIGQAKPTCPRRKWKNKKRESLEFQKDSSCCLVQDKGHKTDTSLQSIETKSIESDISSESDNTYYSADESELQDYNFTKADELSGAFEDRSGGNDTDIEDDSGKDINKLDELSNENEEFCAEVNDSKCSDSDKFNSKCKNANSSQKKRAPSNKQKRKRRDKRKMSWDYNNPLTYIHDNIELSGVEEDINESDLSVKKTVPSLAELCLMSNKGLVSERNTLCKTFRKMYCDIFTETTFHKDQLKWLFCVLSCLEQEEETQANGIKYKPISRWVHHIDKDGLSNKKVFLRCCRNIWNTELYMKRYANPLLQPLYSWGDS
ncbi:uncharacterized protein LOC127711421 isoform X2 [Mytilus californianus]|uniref:uncharacterized protein LOC127711421 isoform X2 n=1 Tax=Mytilus californianus TaxID=6549 RepID=UPI0022468963|nr:uncharacterized protein LOC127711421 isoform X2 [Mytilus californianus]